MRKIILAMNLLLVGCAGSVCDGVDGACVALNVQGGGMVDGLAITLSGAAKGKRVVPPFATPSALPVDVALQLPATTTSGTLHIDVVGVYLGGIVGNGATDVMVAPGQHVNATVRFGVAPGGGGDMATGGGPVGPFTVTGTRVRHFVLPDGAVVDQPIDVSGSPDMSVQGIAALVDNGGTFSTYPGSGSPNGSFTIPSVPSAPYYLRLGKDFIQTSSTSLDLSTWTLGRPTQQKATLTTTLFLYTTNMAPWNSADTLEFMSFNSGTFVFGLESLFASPPAANTTTLNGQSIDLSKMTYGNLIDASQGDRAMLLQLVADNNSGTPYLRLAKMATFSPFTITNGSSYTLNQPMVDVAANQSLSINWSRSQFEQLRTLVNPGASDDYSNCGLFAQPGSGAHGFFTSSPDLVFATPTNGSTDITMTMSYGNPFDPSWPLVAATGYAFAVSYTAAGATATTIDGSVWSYQLLSSLPSPIVPMVGPVLTPTINGSNAFAAQTGVGATPLIAWSPPSIGTPTSYWVTVRQVNNVGGKTQLAFVANLPTQRTSVRIPPGLLQKGATYMFVITAYVEAIDYTVTPLVDAYPEAFADVLTATVTP